MNFAIEKVVDYLYREEERNFQELLDERDLENSVLFLHKLKQHIFYSVVVLKLKGDAQAINEWVNQYWEENGGEEEEEDEEEEYICDKDGCEEGGSEVFPSGLCYCYKHSIEYEDRINEIKIMSA